MNPLQQFVQEKIIMAAHPECENLKEAKIKELKEGCIVEELIEVDIDPMDGGSGREEIITTEIEYDEYFEEEYDAFMAYGTSSGKEIVDIIGHPMTLARVLNTVNQKDRISLECNSKYEWYLDCCSDTYHYSIPWIILNQDGTECTFDQQSEETQEAIGKLLGYEAN